MIAVERLMVRKKLKTMLKKSIEKNNIDIFTGFIIKEKNAIREVYDTQISDILLNALRDAEISADLYSALTYIDDKSPLILEYKALKLYSDGKIDDFIHFVTSNIDILSLANVKKDFDELINKSQPEKAVEYLSIAGVFDEGIFKEYFATMPGEQEIRRLTALFQTNGSINDLEKILSICISKIPYSTCYFSLADIYVEFNQKDKLKELLHDIHKNRIHYNNIDIRKYYSYLGEYEKVVEFSDVNEPDNALLADAYYHLGYYENALKIYKYIYYNEDKNVLERIIDITYAIKDYYSLINYINLIEKNLGTNKKLLLYKIESEIVLDLYSEAELDLNRYRSNFGDDTEVLELFAKYFRAVDNREMLYKIAIQLIETGNTDHENYRIIVNYLYENQEYSKILSYVTEKNLINEFKPEYCSSLIYLNRIEDAIEIITTERSLLDSGRVVDSIFEKIKTNENIRKFNSINKQGTILEMVISYMQGRKNFDYMKYAGKVKNAGSLAGIYILATSTRKDNFFDRRYIRNLLDIDRYQIISSILSNIESIKNGEDIGDMNDSRYFLYPITKALIKTKRYHEASTILDSLYSKDPDAFYYYFRAYIEFQDSNFGDAIKHVEEAISVLDNVDFLALRINIALAKNTNAETYTKFAIDLGFTDIFGTIYNFVVSRNIDVSEEFREYLEKIDIKNVYLYRLKSYCLRDYKSVLKYSALSLLYGGNSEDVVNHYSILKKDNELTAVYFLEHYKNKYYEGYIILSSYYYSKRILKKSLEYFNLAYVRNSIAVKNPLFQELFMGVPLSSAIINAMESTGEWFHLMVYYYNRKEFGKVREITQYHYNNIKIPEFLITRAWENMPVKTFMVGLFNKSHDKILGELLANKFDELELYEDEIDILKTLISYYPDENILFERLINSLIQNGNLNEALETTYDRFHEKKDISSFNRMVHIFYDLRDYSSLANIFNNNREFVNAENIKYWIYSQIKLFNYAATRALMHDYHGIINVDTSESINSKLRSSYRTRMIVEVTKKVFDTEYVDQKVSQPAELSAMVPAYLANDVYEFITNKEPYSYIDAKEYNNESVNIIGRLNTIGISDIRDIKIYHIYKVTGNVIKSKNFYIFIKRCMEGYYKIEKLSENGGSINSGDMGNEPDIIKIITKYNVGLMDAIYIAGKMKNGMLN